MLLLRYKASKRYIAELGQTDGRTDRWTDLQKHIHHVTYFVFLGRKLKLKLVKM